MRMCVQCIAQTVLQAPIALFCTYINHNSSTHRLSDPMSFYDGFSFRTIVHMDREFLLNLSLLAPCDSLVFFSHTRTHTHRISQKSREKKKHNKTKQRFKTKKYIYIITCRKLYLCLTAMPLLSPPSIALTLVFILLSLECFGEIISFIEA